jgi:hypothetical protein
MPSARTVKVVAGSGGSMTVRVPWLIDVVLMSATHGCSAGGTGSTRRSTIGPG